MTERLRAELTSEQVADIVHGSLLLDSGVIVEHRGWLALVGADAGGDELELELVVAAFVAAAGQYLDDGHREQVLAEQVRVLLPGGRPAVWFPGVAFEACEDADDRLDWIDA